MRKIIDFISILMLMMISACGQSTSPETIIPTERSRFFISFAIPMDGATLNYDELVFQVNPITGAEGYSWTFIQDDIVVWDTMKDEQKLTDIKYRIPPTGKLIEKFNPGELQIQVKARINGVWTEPSTITIFLPARTLANIPEYTNTPIPISSNTVQPTETRSMRALTPTPQPGWVTYVNHYLGYQFDYPPSMKAHAEGYISLYQDESIPSGFTFDEYFTYLENVLPDNLCVWIESNVGAVTIAPPGDSIGRFVGPCPGMGIGNGYRFEDSFQTFLVNGEQLQVDGTRLYLESTGELSSEFYVFNLDNGFRVTFISGPVKGQPLESYPEKMELLKKVLSTLTWIRVPDLTIPGTTCAGKYTQLLPGVFAEVAPGDPNRVRSGPSKSSEVTGQLYPGTISLVLEGPVCADGLVYWKVENSTIPGGVGWTAEGDGNEYWLEPVK